jgi:hypothetical protein
MAEAAQDINDCLTWASTPQGSDFWALVKARFDAHAMYAKQNGGAELLKTILSSQPVLKDAKNHAASPISYLRTANSPARLKKAADVLVNMCGWSSTPEGGNFWSTAHTELLRVSDAANFTVGLLATRPMNNQNRKRMLVYAGAKHSEDKLSQ